ncbi:MAG: MerR family transcriptional regulator [Gemmatimonadota bacterium]
MVMRMQELSDRSGLPRTTIHHYLRESLLPPAFKSAPNAAEYSEAHLERLQLITQLRTPGPETGVGLSIPEVRKVVRYVEAGARPEAATRLVRAETTARDGESLPTPLVPAGGGWPSIDELASAAGVDRDLARRIAEAGFLGAPEGLHTPSDLMVLRTAARVCDSYEVDPADLAPFGDLIRELGNYAATLGDLQAARAGRATADGEARGDLGTALRELSEALLWRALTDS